MAIPLILALGGTVVRAVAPRVVQQLMRQGAKKATTQQIKKAGGEKGLSTVTSVKQAKNLKPTRPTLRPSTKVVKPKSGVTSQQRSALSDMGGQTVKLSKPTGGTGRATLKPKTPSIKTQRPSVKAKPRVVKPRASAPKAPPSRPSVPSGGSRFTGFPRRPTTPKAPPSRPISRTQRAANIGKTAAALGTAASMLPNIKEGPKTAKAKAKPSVTGPMSRPQVQGPPKAKAKPSEGKDPRGNQIKPTPGKIIMPKKFDGGYNSKTQRLVNITIDGKKSTYEIPKGMTTKQATNLLTGTVKKKVGGTPSKYKGFSKLPEKVQKKMSPTLASKYKEGGSITGVGNAYLKSKNTGKVARQVKGFGAARRPKK